MGRLVKFNEVNKSKSIRNNERKNRGGVMTDKYKYQSISLKTQTIDVIKNLSDKLVQGQKLSNAKTVQKLVIDTYEKLNPGNDNDMHTIKKTK